MFPNNSLFSEYTFKKYTFKKKNQNEQKKGWERNYVLMWFFFKKRRHIGKIRKDKGDKNRSSKLQNNMCSSIPINWNI